MTDPETVTAPAKRWRKLDVLYRGGRPSYSVAIGYWDKVPSLVMRWDGEADSPKGNPVSTGHPVWFVVPRDFWLPIVRQLGLPPAEVTRVCGFLNV